MSTLIGPITHRAFAKIATSKTSTTSVRPSRRVNKLNKQKREPKYRSERKLLQALTLRIDASELNVVFQIL